MIQRRLHIGIEQRVTIPRRGFELGVKLHANEPRVNVLRQLDNFRQVFALGQGRDHQAGIAQPVQVVHIGFVTVAMPFGDHLAVNLVRQSALGHVRALRAQAHGAAQV